MECVPEKHKALQVSNWLVTGGELSTSDKRKCARARERERDRKRVGGCEQRTRVDCVCVSRCHGVAIIAVEEIPQGRVCGRMVCGAFDGRDHNDVLPGKGLPEVAGRER